MIQYEKRLSRDLLLGLKGSVGPFACLFALPSATFAVVLKTWFDSTDLDATKKIGFTATPYTSFTAMLAFLIIFRTQQAYSRFCTGGALVRSMTCLWCDAACSFVTFTRTSKIDSNEVGRFRELVVRLFSLMNALALAKLSDTDGDDGTAFLMKLKVIDPGSLEPSVIRTVNDTELKVEAVYNMLMALLAEADQAGLMRVAPPVFARALNEMHVGCLKYDDAHNLRFLLFPFPYAQVTVWMMFIHMMATPFMAANVCLGRIQAFCICFLLTFVFWALHEVSVELENPFGNDANDLDMQGYQDFCNKRLLLLLHQTNDKAPDLRTDVALSELTIRTVRGETLPLLDAGVTSSVHSMAFPLRSDVHEVSDDSSSDLDDVRHAHAAGFR
ncbi:unnamed protein product [Prorocentrum cordatum]|uniref:Bestrophin homolog n=1 Tax=Prorocentrum cordatum TaxID=2364126 RepID=A0ABN9TAE4_9DINO|nr:unnamed protein product [Polarella glacialis]